MSDRYTIGALICGLVCREDSLLELSCINCLDQLVNVEGVNGVLHWLLDKGKELFEGLQETDESILVVLTGGELTDNLRHA